MRVEHLREFAVLARHLNFTAAAKELFIAQSTLSAHMAQLEDELGFALFNRDGEVRLTTTGSIYLQEAQAALDLLDSAARRCRDLVPTNRALRIALQTPSAPFAHYLKNELGCPFVFVFHDYQSPFFSMFTNNEADVMANYDYRSFQSLSREADRLGLAARRIAGAPLSITMSTAHPLAAKERVSREDLRGETIVINSAPDYERWKAIVEQVLGPDLGIAFELDPIGDLGNLAFYDYGDRLHVCGEELNEQYLSRRDDIRILTHVEGVDLRTPQVAVWRADVDPALLERIERFCTCWDEFMGKA